MVLDYKKALNEQYLAVERTKRDLSSRDLQTASLSSSFDIQASKAGTAFISHLLISKGLKADIQSKFEEISGTDVSLAIAEVDNLISATATLLAKVDNLLEKKPQSGHLQVTSAILTEAIECLYDSLRLLKRANFKKAGSDAGLGKLASKISLQSIEKVLHVD